MKLKCKTKEIVVIAMLAAVVGVIYTGMDYIYMPLSNLLGPVFLELTFGIYLLSASLPMYIVRKPGIAFVGALITALVNLLLGSAYGIQLVLAGLLQAAGIEIGYLIGKRYAGNLVNQITGSILAALFVFIRDYIVFGYASLAPAVVIGMFAVRILSAVIIGILLVTAIGGGLKKTGVLKGFRCTAVPSVQ